jgi:hypothetical protein
MCERLATRAIERLPDLRDVQRRITMHVHFPELSLAELLDDPLVQLLMASDGVKDTALRNLIQTIRHARLRPRRIPTALISTQGHIERAGKI